MAPKVKPSGKRTSVPTAKAAASKDKKKKGKEEGGTPAVKDDEGPKIEYENLLHSAKVFSADEWQLEG
jgi:hypothetical protein